ncbi:MAG: MurT ligase domain-containing protein [Deinococcales bacterium]
MSTWQALAPAVGRMARNVLRVVRPGGGTTLPGWVALRLDPDFVARTAARAGLRVVITGTNGKTSTMTLVRHFLESSGRRVVANQEGANMHQGIAASLLDGAGDALVMEVDEAAFPKLAPALSPHLVIVTGLFRDQLDRFGEVQTTRRHLAEAIAALPEATLLLNGDDPLVASLAVEGRTDWFRAALPAMDVPSDTPACPLCGGELDYEERYYAHLGRYRCRRCGFANPDTAFQARLGEDGVAMGDGRYPPLPPYLHPYSATAALATMLWLGETPRLDAWPDAVGGRGEVSRLEGRTVSLALVKNPASMSWNLAQDRPDAHVFLINDGAADGVDVSWLWDARYGDGLGSVTVSGTRALEFMIRMRYLEPPPAAAAYPSARDALTAAVRSVPEGGSVLMLSTYTNLKRAHGLMQGPLAPTLPEPLTLPRPAGPGATPAVAGTARPAQGGERGEPARTPGGAIDAGRPVRIAWLYPDQLGTYGDGGNLAVLAQRLRWRGASAEILRLDVGDTLPGDVEAVVIGGGEDLAQGLVLDDLRRHQAELRALFDDGVVGLVICGGYQLLGESFEVSGRTLPGLGLLPVSTVAGTPRLVGRLLVESALAGGPLVGFENHGGRTALHAGAPLGSVVQGHGNDADGVAGEGVVSGHVVGTYLHGPVLARNPGLADRLLGWIGERRGWPPLEGLDDELEREALRRLAPARPRAAGGPASAS